MQDAFINCVIITLNLRGQVEVQLEVMKKWAIQMWTEGGRYGGLLK